MRDPWTEVSPAHSCRKRRYAWAQQAFKWTKHLLPAVQWARSHSKVTRTRIMWSDRAGNSRGHCGYACLIAKNGVGRKCTCKCTRCQQPLIPPDCNKPGTLTQHLKKSYSWMNIKQLGKLWRMLPTAVTKNGCRTLAGVINISSPFLFFLLQTSTKPGQRSNGDKKRICCSLTHTNFLLSSFHTKYPTDICVRVRLCLVLYTCCCYSAVSYLACLCSSMFPTCLYRGI